jgi:hypothetical protein
VAKNRPTLPELQRAVDDRALLPGENPGSLCIEDAVHWLRVYGELIPVKLSLLERLEQSRQDLTDDAVEDLEVDAKLLGAQTDRYKARYEYWLERAKQLGGAAEARARSSPPHRSTQAIPLIHLVADEEGARG